MFLLLSCVLATAQPTATNLTLNSGDRVVWIGNTLVEREQRYGYWEAALHAANPDIPFTLRNLGWSGDTVYGDARAGFDTAKQGFERLVNLTLELKPTVILISYGSNEAFDGDAGRERFQQGYAKLLDALAPAKARIVLLTPIPFEGGPAATRNDDIRKYAETIQALGQDRHLPVLDLGSSIANSYPKRMSSQPGLTENGMHLNEAGYRHTTTAWLQALGYSSATTSTLDWKQLEPLRQAIQTKNELFFHRWRPQNETYLFGFRKHEQGKNAKEIVEFDPLVDAAEKEIHRIKQELAKK